MSVPQMAAPSLDFPVGGGSPTARAAGDLARVSPFEKEDAGDEGDGEAAHDEAQDIVGHVAGGRPAEEGAEDRRRHQMPDQVGAEVPPIGPHGDHVGNQENRQHQPGGADR